MASIQDIAYVLFYEDEENEEKSLTNDKWRVAFHSKMRKADLEVEEVVNPNNRKEHMIFINAHFDTLAKQAEKMRIEIPLDYEPPKPEEVSFRSNCWECCSGIKRKLSQCKNRLYGTFDVDKEPEDFIAKDFCQDDFDIYRGSKDDLNDFFRPALKSLLVYNILIELNIDSNQIEEIGIGQEEVDDSYEKGRKKRGLLYLRMENVYTADFPLHDPSVLDSPSRSFCCGRTAPDDNAEPTCESLTTDDRRDLYNGWSRFRAWFKFQPFWRIRDYFGEKIAFYFAWCGHLIASLWIPAFVGLAIFAYGLHLSIERHDITNANVTSVTTTNNGSQSSKVLSSAKSFAEDALAIIRESFDNNVTPYFALLISIWGTFFTKTWQRRNARLAYEWDVNEYEEEELDRPEFDHRETVERRLPGSDKIRRIVPGHIRFRKYLISFLVLLIMICAACLSVAGVITFRVIATITWFPTDEARAHRFLTASIAAPIMNAVSMILLQFVYNKLALLLTRYENHRTQTGFNDALILKMFCFQFTNSYASLFYIAFFRSMQFESGIFGQGDEYLDKCGANGNCMSQLSFQLLVMMIIKPFPRFCKDIVKPIIVNLLLWFRQSKRNATKPMKKAEDPRIDFVITEKNKADLNDYTLWEYSEKAIQFGYVMLFAASFPLAPLLALITDIFDMRVDSMRLLRMNRRPVAFIAQDIGTWEKIIKFLSIVGVVTNAFLIAFTSQWGKSKGIVGQLWIVIAFEHICIVGKYIITFIVPDVPSELKDRMADETHWMEKKVSDFRDDQQRQGIRRRDAQIRGRSIPARNGWYKLEKNRLQEDKTEERNTYSQLNEGTDSTTEEDESEDELNGSVKKNENFGADRVDNDDIEDVLRDRSPRQKNQQQRDGDAVLPLKPIDRQSLHMKDKSN